MHQDIINNLYELYLKQGYLSEDSVFDALMSNNVSLEQVDLICEALLIRGVIISNDIFDTKELEIFDRSQTDYEQIYAEILSIDASLQNFISYIKKIKPPQTNEWKNLMHQAKSGNQFARNRIIEMYLRVAVKQALFHHKKYDMPLDETIQNACSGVIIAYEKYSTDRSDNFLQHTSLWIRQSIMREGQPVNQLIYIPAHFKDKLFKIYEIIVNHNCLECFEDEICSNLIREIIEEQDIEEDEVSNILPFLERFESVENLLENNEHLFSDEGLQLYEIFEVICKSENNEYIRNKLLDLSDKEQRVLDLRFGLTYSKELTLEEVGQIFKVTRERIRQIEAKAIRKLKTKIKNANEFIG